MSPQNASGSSMERLYICAPKSVIQGNYHKGKVIDPTKHAKYISTAIRQQGLQKILELGEQTYLTKGEYTNGGDPNSSDGV